MEFRSSGKSLMKNQLTARRYFPQVGEFFKTTSEIWIFIMQTFWLMMSILYQNELNYNQTEEGKRMQ